MNKLDKNQMSIDIENRVASSSNGFASKKYICLICGYIYDEALGWPEDNIPPGTKWEDIPDDWACPDCGVSKEDFEPMLIT